MKIPTYTEKTAIDDSVKVWEKITNFLKTSNEPVETLGEVKAKCITEGYLTKVSSQCSLCEYINQNQLTCKDCIGAKNGVFGEKDLYCTSDDGSIFIKLTSVISKGRPRKKAIKYSEMILDNLKGVQKNYDFQE